MTKMVPHIPAIFESISQNTTYSAHAIAHTFMYCFQFVLSCMLLKEGDYIFMYVRMSHMQEKFCKKTPNHIVISGSPVEIVTKPQIQFHNRSIYIRVVKLLNV